jgi:ubiquinone/menaquinone biosynthesis C-methylase UbiE
MAKKEISKAYHDLENLSHDVYNDRVFVSSYSEKIEYNAHNALYERPATLSLIPDVKGQTVLDAGCGPGAYTEWLLERGAIVTAVDYSEEMLSYVKKRVGNKARLFRANMNEQLGFLKDEEFDLIVSSMVLHYLRDWRTVFSEFNRVLKMNGELIFSTHHPFMDYQIHSEGNYHETEIVEDEWPAFGIKMTFYRRPLSQVFGILKETDFRFAELLEPKPLKECKELFPDSYKTLSTKPWFICFKAIKEK